MAIHHHVAHHTRRAVHHLRQRPVEDRKAVAFIIASGSVALLLCVWMAMSYYSAQFETGKNVSFSASAAASAGTASDTAISIDDAIYVKIPQEEVPPVSDDSVQ